MLSEHKILLDFINNRFEFSGFSGLSPEIWNRVVAEASRNRIAPLIYHKITQAKAESMIPTDVLRMLQEKYLANVYRNTVLFHQLTELVVHLNKKEIPVILLKGAHLAEFVYKDIALRPMSDLDIMVREEHLSEAVQIAFNTGYQFFCDNDPAKGKANKNYVYGIMPDFKHFHTLIHPETGCMLEIHCFITSESSLFKIPPSELWQAANPFTLNEQPVFLLSPEDLILHLCLHAAYDHLFEFGLGALYDIAVTINHYGQNLNWKEIQRRSDQWRTNQSLLLSLFFTKKWLGANIPDEIFKDFQIDKMVYIAEERIFKTSEWPPLHQYYIQWRNLRSMSEKVRLMMNVLFPSPDFMANRYLKPKHSRMLFSRYFFRFYQAFQGLYGIAKTVIGDGRYASRREQGDNDMRLREWLLKS